jgi:DNA topoisomerase-3
MKVVIAEKPSVARDLARILGAKSRMNGYFEGEGYQVTWAIGHLIELADTRDYGYPRWGLSQLPILPHPFQTKVTSDPGRARQYEIIANLFRNADQIICATDAGREGELIFRYIYEQSGAKKPVFRFWVSSQTDKAIRDGFANLRPAEDYENLYHAARCRSEADWLVGINATQAFTLKYGYQPPFHDPAEGNRTKPLSLGRVQTPVLKLLVDRYQEVQAFKAETYWELILTLEKEGQSFQAKWFREDVDRFTKEDEGKAILEKLGEQAKVTAANKNPRQEHPPLLYDLTELQKDANKRYNFSAQKTLNLAQDLYETYKTVTYPRTDSRYLSEDIFPLVPDLLRNVGQVSAYAPFVQAINARGITMEKRFFNDAKVSDHHAIIPTETDPRSVSMPRDHYMIYDLVVRRMLGAFLGVCQKELSEIVLSAEGENFRAKGTMIREPGWRTVYFALDQALEKRKQEKSKGKKKKKDEDKELPFVEVGESLAIKDKQLPKKRTKAPSIHTESSILAMMETAGKEMEDEEMREAMKDRGLGTPATRAGMIERLLQRGYIERDKKKLVPTERGIALIDLVRERQISSPELTGEWESRLNKMSRGDYDVRQFMEEVRRFTNNIICDVKGIKPPERFMPAWRLDGLVCPKCKEGKLLKGKRAFGCSRYKEGCNFTISPRIAGKLVEREHLESLIENGFTEKFVQGFTSRQGKRFDARLRFTPEHKVEFFFEKN